MTPEQHRQADRKAQADRLAAHEQEPRDRRWAPGMERQLAEAFGALTKVTGTFANIDCRSVSCSAQLGWPDAVHAQEELRAFANVGAGPTPMPCIRYVVLDEGATSTSSAAGSIVFDCTNSRLGDDDAPTGTKVAAESR